MCVLLVQEPTAPPTARARAAACYTHVRVIHGGASLAPGRPLRRRRLVCARHRAPLIVARVSGCGVPRGDVWSSLVLAVSHARALGGRGLEPRWRSFPHAVFLCAGARRGSTALPVRRLRPRQRARLAHSGQRQG